MAGMLPPFVPPSARVSTQPLPLITEFVFERGEEAVEQSFSVDRWEPPQQAVAESEEATLPSIDDFLLRPAPPGESGTGTAEAPSETEEKVEAPTAAQNIVQTVVQTAVRTVVHAVQTVLEPENVSEPAASEEAENAPAAQEEVSHPDETAEWTESDMEPETVPERPEAPEFAEAAEAAETSSASGAGGEGWVGEERDSFDWQGAANLAAPAEDERRASEEWSSTSWERSGEGESSQDRIVALLGQVARRVRSGELHVDGSRSMSAEAALAAVLTALLTEADGR